MRVLHSVHLSLLDILVRTEFPLQSGPGAGWTWSVPSSCPATLVTAYYNIKSKYPHQVYLDYMENFLTFQDCMVIFTSPDMAETIREMRPSSYPTLIIPVELNQTLSYGLLTEEQWAEEERKDPEQGIGHNRDLYVVWNEKTNFLKIASDNNFFQSSYFLWLDIGALRHKVDWEFCIKGL